MYMFDEKSRSNQSIKRRSKNDWPVSMLHRLSVILSNFSTFHFVCLDQTIFSCPWFGTNLFWIN